MEIRIDKKLLRKQIKAVEKSCIDGELREGILSLLEYILKYRKGDKT